MSEQRLRELENIAKIAKLYIRRRDADSFIRLDKAVDRLEEVELKEQRINPPAETKV